MVTKTYVDKQGTVDAAFLNDIDFLVYNVFNEPTAVGADGVFWVSDGTKYVEESGATVRTSLFGQADLAVADGGTGVSTFTDGGVLLGSGTGAITPMAVLANSEMIVGDGTTDPVAESGTTLRTSIGVGTGDSPTFTGLTLSSNYTNSGQPTFLAHNSASDDNVTGNATVATIDFDTEIFDQGADFSADTFTAPVTGRYFLSASVTFSGVTSVADLAQMRIVTSNRNYQSRYDLTNGLPSRLTIHVNAVADMDSSDTVTVTLQVNGEASDVVDIDGSVSMQTAFSGILLA